jgi:uncharacterized protein YjbI with pentapeptide repeats
MGNLDLEILSIKEKSIQPLDNRMCNKERQLIASALVNVLNVKHAEEIDKKTLSQIFLNLMKLTQSRHQTPEENRDAVTNRLIKLLSKLNEEQAFVDLDLSEQDLSGLDLSGLNLRGTNLTNTKLARSNLRKTILDEAIMINADLQGAMMVDASLIRADLRNAILVSAMMRFAILWGADLSDADLSLADLAYAIMDESNVTNTNFDGTLIRDTDLSKVDMTYARNVNMLDEYCVIPLRRIPNLLENQFSELWNGMNIIPSISSWLNLDNSTDT